MANEIICTYTGNTCVSMAKDGVKDTLHTEHNDKHEHMTPGDMLVAALGACTLTMMSVVAQKYGHNMDGTKIALSSVFGPNAGGLEEVHLHITFPQGTDEDMKKRYLGVVNLCPVHKSLNPAIKFTVEAH